MSFKAKAHVHAWFLICLLRLDTNDRDYDAVEYYGLIRF